MICGNCNKDIYMHDVFCRDMSEKQNLCYDCGHLILRGIEYAEKKSIPNSTSPDSAVL